MTVWPEFESREPSEKQVRSCVSVLSEFLPQDEKQTGEYPGADGPRLEYTG